MSPRTRIPAPRSGIETYSSKPKRAPPRNENGEIVCQHSACSEKNKTFKRLCQWNKHMDNHERLDVKKEEIRLTRTSGATNLLYRTLKPSLKKTLGANKRGGIAKSMHRKEGFVNLQPDEQVQQVSRRSTRSQSKMKGTVSEPTSKENDLNQLLESSLEEGSIEAQAEEMEDKDKQYAGLVMKDPPQTHAKAKPAFCFQKICLLYDGDSEKQLVYAMLDTGSSQTLIFECKLRELNIAYKRYPEGIRTFTSITNAEFKAVGMRSLRFSYSGMPEKHHWVEAYILEDPPADQKPTFDILLGLDHILESGAIVGNEAVLGRHVHAHFVRYMWSKHSV